MLSASVTVLYSGLTMQSMYQPLWELALPLLLQSKRKDFVLHTKMVVQAMETLIQSEGGDSTILIPAAILHDIGWSEVTPDSDQASALRQHIENAPRLISRILSQLKYDDEVIKRITDIVVAHKFTDPSENEKQLLIDADTLSDTYKESFWSDVDSYHKTPRELWDFRSKNTFYTHTAQQLFEQELALRMKEIVNV